MVDPVLIQAVTRLVREVGAGALEHWRGGHFSVHLKGRIDPVTEVDLAVEEKLRCGLAAIDATITFVGEESWNGNTDVDGWVVDPIDGTVNFATGLPQFALSVALLRGGDPCFGIVYAPALGEFFWAAEGNGAWLNGTPIHVRQGLSLESAVGASGFPYWVADEPSERNNIAAWSALLLKARALRRGGCASLDLAYTAAGRFGFYWEPGLKAWDVCAGIVLVREAGGLISGYKGTPMRSWFEPILACAPELQNELVPILSPFDRNGSQR